MVDTTIKAMNPQLKWLVDMLSFFQAEAVTIPSTYRERVLGVKAIMDDDSSGLVSTILDFAISSALVNYRIEAGNNNLTTALNEWLSGINGDLRGKVPTGIKALAKEYFRERWKGSSNIVLRTFWTKQDGLELPTSLFFVDGEDIKVKNTSDDGRIQLGKEKYYIRIGNKQKYTEIGDRDIPLPKEKNEMIFVQRPFESWGVLEPTPYIIKRGIYRNCEFLKLIAQKGEFIVAKAVEYMLVIKKGTEKLLLDGNITYSKEDLQNVSQDLKSLLQDKKASGGSATYTTNFDTDISEYIPDYSKAISASVYSVIEKRIMAGLGLVEIVEGIASTRRESILNPKPLITEVEQGIEDFKSIINDLIQTIIEKNKANHKKWMKADIKIINTPIKTFMDDKAKAMLRSLYDRGAISKRTLVDVVGNLDFDLEVERREDEAEEGLEETMYPPVIQNMENTPDETEEVTEPTKKEEVPADKQGPEKKNFKQSSVTIIGEPNDPRRDTNKKTKKKKLRHKAENEEED